MECIESLKMMHTPHVVFTEHVRHMPAKLSLRYRPLTVTSAGEILEYRPAK